MRHLSIIAIIISSLFLSCEKQDPGLPATTGSNEKNGPPNKVDVCHYDAATGTYTTLSLPQQAVNAHLAHGDYLGVCGTNNPVVTPGYSGLTEAAGVRYRGPSTGGEVYIGVPDLGVGGNRNESNYNWVDGIYSISFSFDASENKISTTINGAPVTEYDFDTEPVGPGCAVGGWNTMDILLVDRLANGTISFNNVMLDSFPLGDFTSPTPTQDTWLNWTVDNFDFSQDFTITGDLVVQGWSGAERIKLQLTVGCN
jgi:hypothetical protein